MCDIQTITLLALNNIKNFGVKTIIDIYTEYEYVNNYTFEIDLATLNHTSNLKVLKFNNL